MHRRSFLAKFSAGVSLLFFPGLSRLVLPRAEASEGITLRLAFGSCLSQLDPQPIWSAVRASAPDAFVFLGDNIYADTNDMEKMRSDYALLDSIPGFARLRAETRVLGTWDDHDFGRNDAGAEYPWKAESQRLMLDFFREPQGSTRRAREGVYESYFFGEGSERVQLILLDLRYHRSRPEAGGTLLGEQQWEWLEARLREPAALRILGSSVQLVSSEHEWEKWAKFPDEKARLYQLLETTPGGIEIHDFTCSGLNVEESWADTPNGKRILFKDNFSHFGLLQIRFGAEFTSVKLEARGTEGRAAFGHELQFPRDPAHRSS